MRISITASLLLGAACAHADEFAQRIRPVLEQHCAACHGPNNPQSKSTFLKAASVTDVDAARGVWRNVATQLRNRTMPPVASKLSEEDRFRVSTWIGERLRQSACAVGDYAGSVTLRRLNRREYRGTLRDLLGIDFAVTDVFPADGSGGEGFDTNGETLFLPPMLLERYMEAAQQALDRAIVTPPLQKTIHAPDLHPVQQERSIRRKLTTDVEVSGVIAAFADGDYEVKVALERPVGIDVKIRVKVDGVDAATLNVQRYASPGGASRSAVVRMARGAHTIALQSADHPIEIFSLFVGQRVKDPPPEKAAVHYRLFGMEPGETPVSPRAAAQSLLAAFVRKAYRRPVTNAEVAKYIALYDRAAERGDPYEERVKLALKAVLVSPDFLFKVEARHNDATIRPISNHELATRLSYFLWSTMPDDELSRLANEGKLQDSKTLLAQVNRMLDDPRSRIFANTFIGQWLGTNDVGGRLVPTTSDVQHFYTPDVAVDLREEPVVLFHHMLTDNRSLLDLLDGDYTFLTERLVNYYELGGKVKIDGNVFQKVTWPDRTRGGLLGLGSVLAMTSSPKQTNPVIRGAWVLDTLLGTPVPTPPPDVPPFDPSAKRNSKLTMRQKLMQHRADPACSACHNLMDPIGFGLENFDWMGRYRSKEANGMPLDTKGVLPTGESFDGPVELRKALLAHKDDFLRHITGKVLGYALGRSLFEADQCTVRKIVEKLEKNNYSARTLVQEVVLSLPFRNSQGPTGHESPAASSRRKPPQKPEK
ncbi:MAG: DUF1592 domain-containing protein [Candidatus Solibacter usitatus]|nr:DUF1592 domain-containing protein [Candidatus Solibacter usitatus]